MISCIQLCLTKIIEFRQQTDGLDEEEEITRSHTELEDMMESLVKRMIKSEMEDFELVFYFLSVNLSYIFLIEQNKNKNHLLKCSTVKHVFRGHLWDKEKGGFRLVQILFSH